MRRELLFLVLFAGLGCSESSSPPAASSSAVAENSARARSTQSTTAAAAPSFISAGAPPTEDALLHAPIVTIRASELKVDDAEVVSGSELAGLTGVQRIEPLFTALRTRLLREKELRPGEPFPGHVVFDVAADVPANVVKSAFQTAAAAGYPNVHFVAK